MKVSDVQVQEQGKVTLGRFIRPGVNELKILDITLRKSQNYESYAPSFFCETRPVEQEGWVGEEGALGQTGKVAGNQGYYIKDDMGLMKFVGFIKQVADALGQSSKINEIEFTDIVDLVEKVKPVLCTGDFARFFVCAKEYQKKGGGIGLQLYFPSRKPVETLSTTPSTLDTYNESNPYHFKRLPAEARTYRKEDEFGATAPAPVDDLPFV